jgi:serine/threonine protein kinase
LSPAAIDALAVSMSQRQASQSFSAPNLAEEALMSPHGTLLSPMGVRYCAQTVKISERQILGRGAFGTVYLGVHQGTGEFVAVKRVQLMTGVAANTPSAAPGGDDSTPEAVRQIEQLASEIRLMRNLKHPNIVRYLNAERQSGLLCIYLEYMPGGSLQTLLERFGPLQPPVLRAYMRHVLRGMQYLHERQTVIHRDIKPGNILLNAAGEAKLSDFGTSRQLSTAAANASCAVTMHEPSPHGSQAAQTPTEKSTPSFADGMPDYGQTLAGTPCFMAPEVARGEPHGSSADIWSLGCTMLCLLTGHPPLHGVGSNTAAAMFQIATHPELVRESIPQDVPPNLRDLLWKCLDPDSANRPAVGAIIQHPFFAATPGSDQATPLS